jgi:hypothetical protein
LGCSFAHPLQAEVARRDAFAIEGEAPAIVCDRKCELCWIVSQIDACGTSLRVTRDVRERFLCNSEDFVFNVCINRAIRSPDIDLKDNAIRAELLSEAGQTRWQSVLCSGSA